MGRRPAEAANRRARRGCAWLKRPPGLVPGLEPLERRDDLVPETYLLLGLTPDSGEPSVELRLQCLHPDDRESAAAAVSQALQETDRVNIEFRISRDGTGPRWLTARVGFIVTRRER